MKLSVVIVNYNVKFFLEQCLFSVYNALTGIEGEVIVIDNCSVDGSEAMVRTKFPQTILQVNSKNTGFAKANNQGLILAKGEYVLLLNPDTVVQESTFRQCLYFMEEHPDAGALGCKMIDGKGNFLPESKRGLPTPLVAFYKIFGFSTVFPRSSVFSAYYLGNTPIDKIQEVEILTGAFLFLRKSILTKVGLLDESFFMFGEDIDFSHRIVLAGYKNYYFPEATIIHYKGESTKKASLNYVLIFYEAMRIFVNKYFTGGFTWLFLFFIHGAIYVTTILSLAKRSLARFFSALSDGMVVYACFLLVSHAWGKWYFHSSTYYPPYYQQVVIPCYVVVVLLCVWISDGYRSPYQLRKVARGMVFGMLMVLVIHALLPVNYRFSRAVILIGGLFSLGSTLTIRFLLGKTPLSLFSVHSRLKKHIAIIGSESECNRVKDLLVLSGLDISGLVFVSEKNDPPSVFYAGNIAQLSEIIAVYKINEMIFCAKDVSSATIIKNMNEHAKRTLDFKIASPGSESVIGSNSSKTSGDLYVIKVSPDSPNR